LVYLYRMEVEKKEAEVLDNAIKNWTEAEVIDQETASRLKGTYHIRESESNVLSVYAFIAAVSCGLLAFGALVMDEKWIELLRRKFGFSEIIVGLLFTLVTALFTYWGKKRQIKKPRSRAGSEAYNLTVILSFSVAMVYLGRSIGYQNGNYAPVLLVAAVVYGAIGIFLRSQLLWITMLITLAGWWGAQIYFLRSSGMLLGLNYPLLMTLFGILVLAGWLLIQRFKKLETFEKTTYICGWVFFLVAAWTLSIFGNSNSWDAWLLVRQGRLWYWALAFTLLLTGLIIYAFRKKDDFLRDICLVFFLLNIYTRYFEYFWDKTNKGLFFSLLAVSFWLVGRKAEQWRKKQMKHEQDTAV
jgi:hypothetical protein